MWVPAVALCLAVSVPLGAAICLPFGETVWQDLNFYDIYTTVVPAAHKAELLKIIRQKDKTKRQIHSEIGTLAKKAGGILKTAHSNFGAHYSQRKKAARQQVSKTSLNPAAKYFVAEQINNIYNLGLSWAQTCTRNNQMLLHTPYDCLLRDIRASGLGISASNKQPFVNTYCLTPALITKYKKVKRTCTCGIKRPKAAAKPCPGQLAVAPTPAPVTPPPPTFAAPQPQTVIPDVSNPVLIIGGFLEGHPIGATEREYIMKIVGQKQLSFEAIIAQIRTYLQKQNQMDLLTELLNHQKETIELQRTMLQNIAVDSKTKSMLLQLSQIDADQTTSFEVKCQRKREIVSNINGEVTRKVEVSDSCGDDDDLL